MENDKKLSAGAAGVLTVASLALAERVHLAYRLYDHVVPTAEEVDTMQLSAQLGGQTVSFDVAYEQASNRAHGKYVLENGLLVVGLLACVYGAYRLMRRALR